MSDKRDRPVAKEVPRYAEAAQLISDFEQDGGRYETLIRRLYRIWQASADPGSPPS